MSRMTKFLKQTCQVEKYVVADSGDAETNRHGEIIYQSPIECKCRYERLCKDVMTTNGSVIRSVGRYFLDEKVDLKVDYRIDGEVVISVETYINESGKIEGYEVYV